MKTLSVSIFTTKNKKNNNKKQKNQKVTKMQTKTHPKLSVTIIHILCYAIIR
jgi:hypothetical protein